MTHERILFELTSTKATTAGFSGSVGAEGYTFALVVQLAAVLASASRSLVSDHPGYLFVTHARPMDRVFGVGVVPARHSRTEWMLAFVAQVASTPEVALTDRAGELCYTARFLCASRCTPYAAAV